MESDREIRIIWPRSALPHASLDAETSITECCTRFLKDAFNRRTLDSTNRGFCAKFWIENIISVIHILMNMVVFLIINHPKCFIYCDNIWIYVIFKKCFSRLSIQIFGPGKSGHRKKTFRRAAATWQWHVKKTKWVCTAIIRLHAISTLFDVPVYARVSRAISCIICLL